MSTVNTGSSQVKVTITATAGDKTAECVVFCRAGGGAGSSSSGTTGTVTGAGSGLFVRSGPAAAMSHYHHSGRKHRYHSGGHGQRLVPDQLYRKRRQSHRGYVSKDYIKVS